MVRTFDIMKKADQNSNINYTVVPTMYDKRTKASRTSLEFLKAHYKDNLWSEQIPVDTLFRESSQRGMPITMLDAKCRGAIAYRNLLVCELTKELENHPDRITPNAAAIVSISDSETPNVTEAKKKNNDMDIMADDMGSMLS